MRFSGSKHISVFLFTSMLASTGVLADVAQEQPATEGLPLKPERTIEFTTDEGTWISLDISRDGNTILFELLGELYTVPITGGDARGIISGMAFDSQPTYSPDGVHIFLCQFACSRFCMSGLS